MIRAREKGIDFVKNQIASSALMKIQKHQSLLAMTRSLFVSGCPEIGDSFLPIAVFLPELGVQAQHVQLVAGEGTAKAVIPVPVAVIEHVYVDFPHQAVRAMVVQLGFSTLSHARNSPFPWMIFYIPIRVHRGKREPLAGVPRGLRRFRPQAEAGIHRGHRRRRSFRFWFFHGE
jgi:hypothetical protein